MNIHALELQLNYLIGYVDGLQQCSSVDQTVHLDLVDLEGRVCVLSLQSAMHPVSAFELERTSHQIASVLEAVRSIGVSEANHRFENTSTYDVDRVYFRRRKTQHRIAHDE